MIVLQWLAFALAVVLYVPYSALGWVIDRLQSVMDA